MKIPLYQVDAFTSTLFAGNPAAVCPLESWLPDQQLQNIAAENNLAETAFFIPSNDGYHLRWFTPIAEVDLCGHATLAAAFVLFNKLNAGDEALKFQTRSGLLVVQRQANRLTLDFPSQPALPCPVPDALIQGLGQKPERVLLARDYLVVFQSEQMVKALHPDMEKFMELNALGVIATARGEQMDFVSRFFAPKVGIPEDPVTGSAHCTLIPYWSRQLNKTTLHARQISARGGELFCEDCGDRVKIAGEAVLYSEGHINL
ncbi:MAG: PhzF family phenazine biosynthesis protein [Candidatus Zhuqueibacterota bacterium]